MSEITFSRVARYPEGTDVEIYPVTNWPGSLVRRDAAPVGTELDTETVTSGSVTFTGLDEAGEYVLYALHGGTRAAVNIGAADARLRYLAVAYGEDGNDITIAYVDPAGNDETLAINVTGTDIEVSLATDGTGEITSTAEEILTAVNADDDANDLVTVELADGSDGSGVVVAVAETSLSGGTDHSQHRYTDVVAASYSNRPGFVDQGELDAHAADTTSVHGIPDSAVLAEDADLKAVSINTVTDDYTLVLADAGKVVEMNNAGAKTITVPPNASVAFPTGTVIGLTAYGAGAVAVAPGAAVTIRSKDSNLDIDGQYAGASLYKRGTNEWVLTGALA